MKYKVNDRVEYYIHSDSRLAYRHGYIKAIRRGAFKTKYVILAVRTDQIHVCSESQILGKMDKKNEQPIKSPGGLND